MFWTPKRQLVAFCLIVLVVPMLMGRSRPDDVDFFDKPIAKIREANPEIVFVGNSMVDSRIDSPLLAQLTGRRVYQLDDGGSQSARWYLFIKNYLLPSGVRPKRVFLFFRDDDLSRPGYRLTGDYRAENQRAMRDDDVEVLQFMDAEDRLNTGGPIGQLAEDLYPVQRRGIALRDLLTDQLIEAVSVGKDDTEETSDDLENTFDTENLRPDVVTDLTPSLEPTKFSADPTDSLLPSLIKLARTHQIPLVLIRVKRAPDDQGYGDEWDRMVPYMKDLEAYLKREGIPFHDMTFDREVPREWYGDGDHIAKAHKQDYTRLFYRKFRTLLE